jgi:hypothetical protein
VIGLALTTVLGFTIPEPTLPSDGGMPVEQLYPVCGDAPLAEVTDGGLFEPWLRVKHNNCKLSACESYANDKMLQSDPTNPGLVLGLVGGGVALVILGVVVGYFIPHSVK